MWEVVREDARGTEVIATLPQRRFNVMWALVQPEFDISAAIVSLTDVVTQRDPSQQANRPNFQIAVDNAEVLVTTSHRGIASSIRWYMREVEA